MLVYAGIDEAGYGPLLGPLCVACTTFVVADHDPDVAGPCDLWKRLKKSICRKRTDKRKRIAVDDSKKLKLPNDVSETTSRKTRSPRTQAHPLKYLERGVLGFHLAKADSTECPSCDGDLFNALNVAVCPSAWYGSSTSIPVAQTLDELRIASSRLKRTLEQEGVTCQSLRCEAIDENSFNRQVHSMGTKSSVNFCAVMRHIDSVWQQFPNDHPRIIVDRQGGRMHYLQDLLAAYPKAHIQVLAETDTLSRYRLEQATSHGPSHLTVSFQVEAEASHLPVALASMIAKYVRELMMMRLNRYFRGFMPELKPTAGYTEDARRYIVEIEPLIARLGVDRQALIRNL